MKILKNRLENELNIRTEKNYPIQGIEFIDIMPLCIQSKIFNEIIEKFTNEILTKNVDYIVAPEARGFIFGAAVANNLKIGCIPVRKKGKLPPSTIEKEFEYEKESGKDILVLPKLVKDEYKNKKFYIIDDIFATGNTIKSIENAIKDLGGQVIGKGVVMNIVELNNEKEIFSLIEINEE